MTHTQHSPSKLLSIAGAAMALSGFALLVGSAPDAYADGRGESSGGVLGGQVSEDDLPDTLTIPAIIRDFRGNNLANGHPDFEAYWGPERMGILEEYLDEDGLPVIQSLSGSEVQSKYYDSQGRSINPALYDASRGDIEGSLNPVTSKRYTSFDSFNQWYRDIPGVNASTEVELVLTKQPGSNVYVFDSSRDEPYRSLGGFFPIDGELFGNWMTNSRNGQYHNYHFTTQVETEFSYERGDGDVFRFSGDDDVWVFIDGRLVIDLGGLHSVVDQYLELDRLDWLTDGKHKLTLFHAERRFRDSNFRIETTLQLRAAALPTVAGMAD